ncbi:MAG: hypothetical protein WC670_10435 [Pseudolabrys sp.]
METGYRCYLAFAFSEEFYPPAPTRVSVFDRSMWRYSAEFGYDYVPGQTVAGALIDSGRVILCATDSSVNSQGNTGPEVPDYESADFKIAVFGDSFSASQIDGETWVSRLQKVVDGTSGKRVRVFNAARDGFGLVAMVEMAASKVTVLKPDLIIIAFNSTALLRAKTWRMVFGEGHDARLIVSASGNLPPKPGTYSDFALVDSEATLDWCEKAKASGTTDDEVIRRVLRKAVVRKAALPSASLFDVRHSFVVSILATRDPFAGLRPQFPPGTNPVVQVKDYREDPGFVEAIRKLDDSGVPYLFIHLPLGASLRDGQEYWVEPGFDSLLASLPLVSRHEVHGLKNLINIPPSEAMDLCKSADDCHPSIKGMDAYAHAVATIIADRLK